MVLDYSKANSAQRADAYRTTIPVSPSDLPRRASSLSSDMSTKSVLDTDTECDVALITEEVVDGASSCTSYISMAYC